jgi:hypothetical protein
MLKLSTMLAKLEVTEGTDATPAAADGFFAMVQPPNPKVDVHRVAVHTGAGSLLPSVVGSRRFEGQATVLLRGAGTAYSTSVLPKADSLLRLCGFAGTLGTGTTGQSYTLRSSGFESFSVYQYVSGVLYKLLGCRGLPVLTFPLGGVPSLQANLRALYAAPTDVANVVPTGEPSLGYPVMLASAFQIGTGNFAAKHGEIKIDFGRTITPREDATATTGYAGMEMLPDRVPVMTVEAEATLEGGFPFFADLVAGTQLSCSFQAGTTQWNQIKVNIPVAQFEKLEHGEKAGVVTYKATFILTSPTGVDNEITITFS